MYPDRRSSHVASAAGLGVLYRQRTGSIATAMLAVYAAIAAFVAAVKTASTGVLDVAQERVSLRSPRPGRRGCRRGEPLFQEGQGAHGHDGRSRRATSKRSSRRRARSSRSAWSTSAPTRSGRVVNLAVNEGDRVKVGQFLLQIDPKSLQRAGRQRRRLAAGGAGLARRRCGRRSRPREAQLMQAQQNLDAPAGSLEAAADHARGAGKGGERRQGRRVERCRSARSSVTPQESRINVRNARRSTARATI